MHTRPLFAFLLAALCLCGNAPAWGLTLPGPAGNVKMELSVNPDGHLVYSVSTDGKTRLEPAPVGIIVDGNDLGATVRLGKPASRRITEVFPWRGNKKTAETDCIAYEIPVHSAAAEIDWIFEVRIFDDGAAFRYRVPNSGACHITGESTELQIPADTEVWFQTDTSAYEGAYSSLPSDQAPPGPVGLPMTLVYPDDTYAMISEAGLFRYSGMSLRPEPGRRFKATFNDNEGGWDHEGEIVSPWRLAVLSRDLTSLVNQDIIASLNDPPDPELFPEGLDAPWILTGKALCTWMILGNPGAHWAYQKPFVDDCHDLGCEFLLVDAGWRTRKYGWVRDGVWKRAAELCRYAATRNVGIILWHSYADMEQHGHGPSLLTPESRESFLKHCALAGVKGVKIDFFNAESKEVVDVCEDLSRRAAKYKLTINFHGIYKPTGEMRKWPNEISREGIREQENKLSGELELAHYGALPFTRFAAGHADFLPGFVQPDRLGNTTLAFQAAALVIFSSPFLCLPDTPGAYRRSQLRPLIHDMPVTWDETRILPGSKVGEMVIMARRKETQWYLAAINCRPETSEIEIDLNSLNPPAEAKMTIYRDGESKELCDIQDKVAMPEDGKLIFSLVPGGGVVVQLH